MAGASSVAGEVFVDALPYFDQGYDAPGVREAAAALVEEETRRYRPTKNYLSYLTTPDFSAFETEIMKNEFERLAARQPLELLSMKRYELPAPSSGQKNDMTAWQDCVNNSMAQLEHQAVRIENLEVMAEYGTNAWKITYQLRFLLKARVDPVSHANGAVRFFCDPTFWAKNVVNLGNLVIEKVPPPAPHPQTMMVGQQISPGHNAAGKHPGQINLAQLRLQHLQQAAFVQKQQQQQQHQQQHQQQMQQQMRIASQMSQHPRQGGTAQMMQQQ
ncbi:pre-mRNA-splicing factor SPF27, partial [Tachysurus ichikawai]